ncbi:MAG: IS21 family transposase [Alteromonadaceae bacterium]|nr:MAG: IS21 family transposase [Alteromonadaceae bacterium]
MQKIKDILRLTFEAKLSIRKIAHCLNLSVGAISKYLTRAKAAGLGWPLPEELTDQELALKLQPPRVPPEAQSFPEPDFNQMHSELSRKGMTLQLLWQEYAEIHPDGHYSYSRFTVLYRQWNGKKKLSMRQVHIAGEKLFVDYCGPTMEVVNPDTAEVRTAQIFVAVLGASSYTFAEATWSQKLPDWIGSHVRAFHFYGGVPEIVVPDNLKSAVSKACRYDPDLNPTYQQLSEYYSVAIIPARPYKPKDKSKAEVGVQIVERWIMMRLRKQLFFTLASLNQAIVFLLDDLNRRPFKKRPNSRLEEFELLDKPALKPLPESPYEYREIKKVRVHPDYHVEYDNHYYSVPYQLVKQALMLHAGVNTVVVFHQNKQVAVHPRAYSYGHTTDSNHMAKAHKKHQEWSPQRFTKWASDIGEYTTLVVEHQLTSRAHPEHGYRACLGLLSLIKKYDEKRLEDACKRAYQIKAMTYKSIASILSKSLDKIPLENNHTDIQTTLPFDHDNVRGPDYYTH